MNGWMSWVTASSPAMNSAHSRVAQSRSTSDSDSQSARSREKSMSAGSQNFALPPANSFNGRLFQLSPPALIDCECVRVMFDLLRSKVLWQWLFRRRDGGLGLWGYGSKRGRQDCDEPSHGQCRLLRRRFVKPEDRIHAAHVRRQRQMRKDHQQERQQRVGVAVGAQIPACVRVAHERSQNFQVMTMYDRAHADARVGVDLETRRGMKRTLLRMIGEVRDPAVEKVGEK